MHKLLEYKKLVFILLIMLLILFRIIPHPPNFTPIISVAVLGGYLFSEKILLVLTLIISMIISDIILGFHQGYFIIYTVIILIALVSNFFLKNLNFLNTFLFSIIGSAIFFILTNFGVWAFSDMYEKNINGLILCYYMAIPFFGNTLASTIFFSSTIYCSLKIFKIKFNLQY